MKTTILGVLLTFCASLSFSQDVVTQLNGEKLECKVLEITDEYIKYRRYQDTNGPIRNLSLAKIVSIAYQNGNIEEFNTSTSDVDEAKADPLMDFLAAIRKANLSREFIYKNGFFFDGLTGVNIQRRTSNSFYQYETGSLGFRVGQKWYFGKSLKNRIGIQVTWMRVGFYFSDGIDMVSISPLGVGLTNITAFGKNKNSGMEINFSVAPVLFGDIEDPELYLAFNPEIKFRYHFMSFGVDYRYSQGEVGASYRYANHNLSMSIGAKF
ncbi:MAG: hypothetical protein QNK23_13080 [Crocinitomicaceae bacterium]|nr:hypothetical protein [Crocinitomicaceae bacterium]